MKLINQEFSLKAWFDPQGRWGLGGLLPKKTFSEYVHFAHQINPLTALPRAMLGVNTASYTPVPRVLLGLNMD